VSEQWQVFDITDSVYATLRNKKITLEMLYVMTVIGHSFHWIAGAPFK